MAIIWTKDWTGGDDGTIVGGIDLKNIQDDLSNVLQAADTISVTEVTVTGGVVTISETTTPTPLVNYGKIYTKADNNLYFQDGAGVEHQLGEGLTADSVEISHIADGTDGELITWDAAGEATTVPTGSSGEVLTSNGAGTEPTFQAAAAASAGMSILDYGGSLSASTERGAAGSTFKMCTGYYTAAGTTATFINLPFTSLGSYAMVASPDGPAYGSQAISTTQVSGASCILRFHTPASFNWVAMGT